MVVKSDICPFENDVLLKLTIIDKLKIALANVTIVPIRLFFLCFLLVILWFLGIVGTTGRAKEDLKKPLDGWRSFISKPVEYVGRALFFACGFHSVKTFGKVDKDVKIFIFAPHMGYFDHLKFVYMNYPSAVARMGCDEVPLFGKLVTLTQALIVDRENSSSRSSLLKQIQYRLNSPYKWPKIGIYPEGTTTNGKALIQFKSGAFIPAVPVQPVCFKYKFKHDSISWAWKGPNAYILFWLTLCQLNLSFEIHYLPVYNPSDEEKQNAELYANNVRILMAEYLKLPISDYSYDDCRVAYRAKNLGLPWDCGKIKTLHVTKKLGIRLDKIFELLPLYAKLANLKTGLVHLDTFNEYMQIDTSAADKFYDLFDKDRKGYFRFGEFIQTYVTVIQKELDSKSDYLNSLLDVSVNFTSKYFPAVFSRPCTALNCVGLYKLVYLILQLL